MRSLFRLCLSLTVAGALLAGLASFAPGWAAVAGLDLWELPGLLLKLSQLEGEKAELVAREKAAASSLLRKEAVFQELIRGQRTLLQAAAHFRDIDANRPEAARYVRRLYKGRSDEERWCRQVIAWSNRAALGDLASRLEEELREHLERDGILVFPE